MKYIPALICAAFILCLPVFGTETQFITFKGKAEFSDPVKTLGTGVHSKEYLTLIPRLEKIYSPAEPIVWSVIKAGNTVYAGVGETGKILYFVDGGEQGILAELGTFAVKALAADSKGAVCAGGPEGKVFKFTELKNQSVLYETGEKYVWSLLPGDDGKLFAGTGPSGKIFSIASDGTGELLYDGEEDHILCLARSGNYLFAGTSGTGLIYRIDLKNKKGDIFAELPGSEVISMFVRDGEVYAVSKLGKSPAAGTKSPAVKKPAGPKTPPPKPSIYRIPVEGGEPEVFFECPAGNLMSIAPLPDGTVAAGTDGKGIIYIVKDKDNFIMSSIQDTGKVLDLFPLEDGFLAATEKKGFICRAKLNGEMSGEFISKVNAINEVEKWGVAEIDEEKTGKAEISYEIRTGRNPNTDEQWSKWKDLREGELSSLDTGCRYFQLRIQMKDEDGKDLPKLKKLVLSYLPRNIAPEISMFMDMAAAKKNAPPQPPKPGLPGQAGPPPKKPVIVLQWKAMDRNMDLLKYSLALRAEGEDIWMTVAEDIPIVKYNLDTTFIPDGKYMIRLTASDESVNMDGKGFAVNRELDDYTVIDKTPPEIGKVSVAREGETARITCSVKDNLSNITHGFYRLNNGDWMPIYPEDLLFDEPEENFSFSVDNVKDNDFLFIRFIDAETNFALYRTVIK